MYIITIYRSDSISPDTILVGDNYYVTPNEKYLVVELEGRKAMIPTEYTSSYYKEMKKDVRKLIDWKVVEFENTRENWEKLKELFGTFESLGKLLKRER